MEQPCYKCGQAVEEGVAFCPHCSAPQIRVMVAEAPAGLPLPEAAATPSGTSALPTSHSVPVMALPTQWGRTVRPCALAALVASLLMVLGLNPFVTMISVGFLAVVFYRQREVGRPMGPALGARLGAVGGLFWFCLSAIVQGTLIAALGKGPELKGEMLKKIEQAAAGTADPQARQMVEYFKTPGGLAVLIVFAVIFAIFVALILGTLGGALGGSLFSRRDKS